MPTLYKIAGWQKHFEVYDAKRIDGPLKWVAVPTKTDGFGFSRLRAERDRCALLAAWYLLLGIAAKQPKASRGQLARDGVPLTPADLELMTGFPASVFSRAFEFFSQPAQGWLVAEKLPVAATSLQHPPGSQAPTEQDKTGQDRTVVGPNTSALRRAAGAAPATVSDWITELQKSEAYAHIDVAKEFAKMQVWCRTHRRQPTRRRFVAWLNRIEPPLRTGTISPAPSLPAAPKDWRGRLHRLYPEARADLTWATLHPDIRTQILTA